MAANRVRRLEVKNDAQENETIGTRLNVLKSNAAAGAGPSNNPIVTRRNALGDRNQISTNAGNNLKKTAAPVLVTKPEVRKPLRAQRNFIAENKNTIAAAGAKPLAVRLPARARVDNRRSATGSKPATRQDGKQGDATLPSQVHRTTAVIAPARPKVLRSGAVLGENVARAPTPEDVHMASPEGKQKPADKSISDAFSADVLAAIPNIDEEDNDNPLMVADYVTDIYKYMHKLEQFFTIREKFLQNKMITSKMRSVLVDWLVQVQLRFQLLPETLYMTVALIDRYLQDNEVHKRELQLVGVTAMFIASKYEEIYAPEVNDFVYISDDSCSANAIRDMEVKMLRSFSFQLGRPLHIHFLRRYSKAADANSEMHTLGKYLCELSLVEYDLAHCPPSLIAAAACYISMKLLADDDNEWDNKMHFYSTYKEEDVMPVVKAVILSIIRISKSDSKYQTVRNKFKTGKFLQISLIPELKEENLRNTFAISA